MLLVSILCCLFKFRIQENIEAECDKKKCSIKFLSHPVQPLKITDLIINLAIYWIIFQADPALNLILEH